MTPDARAQALIDSLRREFPESVMSGRQRAVLALAIASEIHQAKAEVWAEVKRDCDTILDTGRKGV
jgi:hypothetical protein